MKPIILISRKINKATKLFIPQNDIVFISLRMSLTSKISHNRVPTKRTESKFRTFPTNFNGECILRREIDSTGESFDEEFDFEFTGNWWGPWTPFHHLNNHGNAFCWYCWWLRKETKEEEDEEEKKERRNLNYGSYKRIRVCFVWFYSNAVLLQLLPFLFFVFFNHIFFFNFYYLFYAKLSINL